MTRRVLETARRYFDEDIQRAEALLALGGQDSATPAEETRADLRSAAVAMAVGAMDAYFCAAYVDCLAKRLQGASVGTGELPRGYRKRELAVGDLLNLYGHSNQNWALRLAARNIMEKKNVLKIDDVNGLFNPVLPQGQKLWGSVMERLVSTDWKRLTGIGRKEYEELHGKDKEAATKDAIKVMKDRIQDTIQLRHEWVHNCGRPDKVVKTLTPNQAAARVREIRAVVEAVDDHLMAHRQV